MGLSGVKKIARKRSRDHSGRYPLYTSGLMNSGELRLYFFENCELPPDFDHTQKLTWKCEVCNATKGHTFECSPSRVADAKREFKSRSVAAAVRKRADARVQEQSNRAATRQAASASTATPTATAPTAADTASIDPLAQDADADEAEENARRIASRRDAVRDDEDVEGDGNESDSSVDSDSENPPPPPTLPSKSDPFWKWLFAHLSIRKKQLPTRSGGFISDSSAWRQHWRNMREFLPVFPLKTSLLDVQVLLMRATLCWLDPGLFFPDIWDLAKLKCPCCGECGVDRLGYDMNPRVCAKLDGSLEFVMVVRWQHVDCPKRKDGFKSSVFSALNPSVYAQLSPSSQAAFGYVARSRGVVVDVACVRAIDHFIPSGTSASSISKLHKKLVNHTMIDAETIEMDLYQASVNVPRVPLQSFFDGAASTASPPAIVKPNGVSMRRKGSVFDHVLSPVRVMDLYRESSARRQDWSLAFNGSIPAVTVALDHSFQILKFVFHTLDGKRTRMFTAVLILSNHAGQVVGLFYTTSKSLKACEEGLSLIHARLVRNNKGRPIVAVFSDQPRLDRPFLRRAWKVDDLIVLLDIFHAIQDLKTCGYAHSPCFRALVRELSESYLHRIASDVADQLNLDVEKDDERRVKKGLQVLSDAEVVARLVLLKRRLTYHRPFQVSFLCWLIDQWIEFYTDFLYLFN
jgi:hypothetical protein